MKVCCVALVVLAVVASTQAWGAGSIGICPEAEPPVCPESPNNEYGNLLPHPTDCNFFVHCHTDRQPICKQCPDGLHFNANAHICDWPSTAGCKSN